MKNRPYTEPENTILEVLKGDPIGSISLLVVSIDSFFNNELSITAKNKQTRLLFIGIHAVALTISEAIWDMRGPAGYGMFLERFVDEEQQDRKFSKIAIQIHEWRNTLAHQFLSSGGHNIDYDYDMLEGYKLNQEYLIINPAIYLDSYIKAFKENKILNYVTQLDKGEQEKIRLRILGKYINR